MPKVSIIMPNYNGEKYIEESIKSVLNQTYQDFELIIIDDNSSDNSRKIIDSFDDKRIIKYYSDTNRHVAYTVNIGFKLANGDYIARIDSDDIWKSEKLEKQVEFLENNKEYGACFTRVHIINHNSNLADENNKDLYNLFNLEGNKTQNQWLKYFMYNGNCLCNSSVLIRTCILETIGKAYDISYVPAQDFEMWTRLVVKAPIYIMEEKLTLYRWEDSPNKISGNDLSSQIAFFNVHSLIKKHIFDCITDEEFTKFYKDEFKNPNSSSSLELDIEKAYILLDCERRSTTKWLVIEKFKEILVNPNALELLENKYGFDLKEYYKLYRENNLYDPTVIQEIEHLRNRNVILDSEKNNLIHEKSDLINNMHSEAERYNQEISNILNSLSWKVTSPLRWIMSFIRGTKNN